MKKFALAALLSAATAALAAPVLADIHANQANRAAAFARTHGEALSGAINHPTRAEDKARDQHRHPAETLSFFEVAPDMKVGEYAPGGGWYSRLLGHYLGGQGKLVGLFFDTSKVPFADDRKQAIRAAAGQFPAEVEGWTGLSADRFSAYTLDAVPEGEAGTFDRILIIRMMHNLNRWSIADSELKAMRALLKEDGMVGIVQHRAKADAPWAYANGDKGYVREADVIDLMRVNGFELVGKSEINANPKDPANHEGGVWEMPPVQSTKRADLAGLGESDRMTLLFRKAK
jgi:predicted methyltransferase